MRQLFARFDIDFDQWLALTKTALRVDLRSSSFMRARLGAQARAGLSGAIEAIPPAERHALQPCLIMGALQEARLAALAAHDYVQVNDTLQPLKRLWIAWRAAGKALRSD